MERFRILVIENSLDVTGALKSITSVAVGLKEHYDFQFVIPSGSRSRFWIERMGFSQIHELPMVEISKRVSSLIRYFPLLLLNTFRLRMIVKREKVDLIHANDLYNLLPVVYKMLGGVTLYVCHIRFLPDRFPKALFNVWLRLHQRYAAKIISVSHAVSKQLDDHPKNAVIYDELPLQERYPETLESDANKSTFTFLYLSNFMEGKGQNFTLEAFAKIYNSLPHWKLRFVGGDMGLKKNKDYINSLKRCAQELGIDKKIEWATFTEDVESEYKQAEIVLNFSESESFSITCLEALYFGRPLIATDCGGPAEIIDNGITGVLVTNKNVNDMAEAMIKLALEKASRDTMGLKARQTIREKFHVTKTTFRIKEVYDIVLKQR
jgi:glycosyltransferase involved in cell wall biosynthesis